VTTSPPRPWYESAFDSGYLERYAHRDRGEAEDLVERLLAVEAVPREGRVLDLCCGGGRHLVAMARRGVDVGGFDLSATLLRSTRELAKKENLAAPRLTRGDMRRLPFADGSFSGVTHFFTAFGYFEDDETNFNVFREVARILQPGGSYLFDFFNATVVRAGLQSATDKRLSADGRRVEKVIQTDKNAGKSVVESVRLFEPDQLRSALLTAGLQPINEWGDYSLSLFEIGMSPRWMVLCQTGVR
jgi:ubiquinone/menaquinone biosynthesis C-methylase UbiE